MVFANNSIREMVSLNHNAISCKQFGAHFKFCQVKTHDQTAYEHHDLNISQWFQKASVCAKIMQEFKFTYLPLHLPVRKHLCF